MRFPEEAPLKVVFREVLHPIKLDFGHVDLGGEGGTGEPGEKSLGEEQRTNNQLNPYMATSSESNPGYIGGRRVQSPPMWSSIYPYFITASHARFLANLSY